MGGGLLVLSDAAISIPFLLAAVASTSIALSGSNKLVVGAAL